MCWCSTKAGVFVVLCAIGVALLLRSLKKGDGTAQGVARARHIETIYPVEGVEKVIENKLAQIDAISDCVLSEPALIRGSVCRVLLHGVSGLAVHHHFNT